jgi:hypothetical protein
MSEYVIIAFFSENFRGLLTAPKSKINYLHQRATKFCEINEGFPDTVTKDKGKKWRVSFL